jgi:hypothetical protein
VHAKHPGGRRACLERSRRDPYPIRSAGMPQGTSPTAGLTWVWSQSAFFLLGRLSESCLYHFLHQGGWQRLVQLEVDGPFGGLVPFEFVPERFDHGCTREQTAIVRKRGEPHERPLEPEGRNPITDDRGGVCRHGRPHPLQIAACGFRDDMTGNRPQCLELVSERRWPSRLNGECWISLFSWVQTTRVFSSLFVGRREGRGSSRRPVPTVIPSPQGISAE